MLGFLTGMLRGRIPKPITPTQTEEGTSESQQPYSDILPEPLFQWNETRPAILHPYESPYILSLGMRNITTSELIPMDGTYLDRITERKLIMETYPEMVLGCEAVADASVKEMYSWLTMAYLPRRFPAMFELCKCSEMSTGPTHIRNLVDGELYSLAPPTSAVEALKAMGSMVDEDLHFMLPASDKDGYCLSAFVNCFANGSHTRDRLNVKLRDIHKSIPGYHEHLEKRLDLWFDRLEAGKIVMRSNWAITDDNRMFVPSGHVPFENEQRPGPGIDMDKIFVRSERQTLRRLPVSGAIVFSVKTYLYPIADIKAAGYGQDLIRAIDGLDIGNAAGMSRYKKGDSWGDEVKSFLSAE